MIFKDECVTQIFGFIFLSQPLYLNTFPINCIVISCNLRRVNRNCKQAKALTQQTPACDFICQLHSSVQLVTFALGWVQLISGQYCFAHRYDIVELKLLVCVFCSCLERSI